MMFLLVLYPTPYFEAEYCLFCGRRRVAVAGYQMICLVLVTRQLDGLIDSQDRQINILKQRRKVLVCMLCFSF